jgi:protein gp37
MADGSKIEWTEASWNPVTGCTEVSSGCDNCYAKTFAERWRGTPGHPYEQGFDLTLRPERLDQPIRWTRGRRIFVNSMSDLFHDGIPDDYIAQVFAVMALTPWHTYQVLTKRHGRMRALLRDPLFEHEIRATAHWMKYGGDVPDPRMDDRNYRTWPLPNVWLGVSVESQQWADIRIPALLDTPAEVRFLSCEPLLGPVSLRGSWHDYLTGWRTESEHAGNCDCNGRATTCPVPVQAQTGKVGWVIVGAESGRGARPMDDEWARTIKDQCVDAGVPFFLKQFAVNGRKVHVPELDGRQWMEYPKIAPQISSTTPTLL